MEELLLELKNQGIDVIVEGQNLKLKIPESHDVSETIEKVKRKKSELIKYIIERRSNKDILIEKTESKQFYSLSSEQKRLYFLYEFDKTSLAYNMLQMVKCIGNLDRERLQNVFVKLISKHENLRTVFPLVDGLPVQQILVDTPFHLESFYGKEEEVTALLRDFVKPFDLSSGPLMRVGLLQSAPDEQILMVDMHHIITDGVSRRILMEDFVALYKGEAVAQSPLQYKDYAEWQQQEAQQIQLEEHKGFWMNEFAEGPNALDLPKDFPRPTVKCDKGASVSFSIDAREAILLRSIGEKEGATMFMTILSIFNVWLSKLGNQEDIIVGTPVAVRPHLDLDSIMGMFVNTLALRNYPSGNQSFVKLLSGVKERTLSCFKHQSYQFGDLIETLKLPRDSSRNPLFDVMFVFQSLVMEDLTIPGTTLRPYAVDHHVSQFDLTMNVEESSDQLHLHVEYSTALFTSETIERFIDYFKRIVTAVVSDPAKKLSEINIVSFEERNLLLNSLNNSAVAYPNKETVIDLFKSQVSRTPDQVAVVFEGTTVTYDELDKRSDRLGYLLRKEGVERDTIVSLLMDRSIDTIVGMLSILKAGGAYLPIDIDYPEDRISYLLEDSASLMLLTKSDLVDRSEYGINTLFIDELEATEEAIGELSLINEPSDLCYIIYTSGTTGHPKGVMVEHRNVVRLFCNEEFQFDFGPEDVWTMFHSPSFDFSVWEMYGALLYGGKLIVIPKMLARDPEMYLNTLREHGVTVLNQTPSAFYNMMTDQRDLSGLSLRYVIFGGEALSPIRLKAWKSLYPQTKLVNMFGITETTVHVTYKELTADDIEHNIKTIGRPIPTLSVYLLDAQQQLVAPGVKGELFIGGGGVTRGYLNNESLTEQKFITNPYAPTERLYRSGDLARLMNNGELEYLGRIDDQVQLRGFRIELGEIESCLSSHEQISEAVVINHEQDGDQYLVSYYVSTAELDASGLRMHLSSHLPDYMLPSHYVHLDKIPLTSNGKVDRKRLPSVELTAGEDYVAPRTETERKLVEIWSEVLNIDSEVISVTQSFFELGGHSLKATLLINKISKELEVLLPLKQIFTHQDIRSLAELINQSEKENYSGIQKAPKKDKYPLSAAQRRLYFLYEFNKESLAYNLPQSVRLEGKLDKDKLEDTFTQLIAHHESLRTCFVAIDGEISQKIIEDQSFKIEYFESTEAGIEQIRERFIRTFDLYQGPMIRVGLIAISEQSNILMIDMHHIITDGVSQGILIRDFMSLYGGKALPETDLQYKDYAEWQQHEVQQSEIKIQRNFWLNLFAEDRSTVDLPTDFKRPIIKNHEGSTLGFEIGHEETQKLKLIGDKTGSTMFMVLLSIYYILLSKLTNQEDIVIGTPVAGRQHADLRNIMGMFVNTLPLRNYPKWNMSFKEFLATVKSSTLECFDNQSYQYETLLDELKVERDTSRNPLFDVMFAHQNMESSTLEIPGLTISSYDIGHKIAKFDLTIYTSESKERVSVNFEYSTDLFKEETIKRFVGYFQRIVSSVVSDADIKLSDIDVLSEKEKHQVLNEFNNTSRNYLINKPIHQLFEEQVHSTPEHLALVFKEKKMSYLQLNKSANSVGKVLRDQGVKPNDLVCIVADRSMEMIIGMLSILKSGGAFLPIDPDLPLDRINYMIKNSGSSVLISKSDMVEKLNYKGTFLDLDDLEKYECVEKDLVTVNKVEDLAYVIYTSGSTGKPKGVMVEHKSLVNLCCWHNESYGISSKDHATKYAGFGFDASVWETFPYLIAGGCLHIISDEIRLNVKKLNAYYESHGITMSFLPTQVFEQFIELKNNSLRYLLTGGDKLKISRNCNYRLVNNYGPTENTVVATSFIINDSYSNIPIGKPISNSKVYVLDRQGNLLPIGVAGELCIGGEGLARGYLNNEALTLEKFVEDPFNTGERMYRTGDLTRWRHDGNLEFLGRMDEQVKIRGVRVELGEIENHLATHSEIQEAIVVANGNGENTYMVAYYVSISEIDSAKLRKFLLEQLPDYMVPTFFVHMEHLPLTPNGKLDRKSLPYHILTSGNDYKGPSTDIEQQLLEIWAEVLDIEKAIISVDKSFFELGGHSLMATNLVTKIFKKLNVQISLIDFFRRPSISQIADFIEARRWLVTESGQEKTKKKKVVI